MGRIQTRTVVALETFSGTSNVNLGLTAGGQIQPVPTSGDTKGEACPRLPLISRSAISSIITNKGRLEQVNVQTLSFTAANSTNYSFRVSQVVNGVLRIASFNYLSDATATAAEIAAAIVATFNAQVAQGSIFVTATGSGSPVTLTANEGFPLFTIYDVSSNITVANGMANINTALQAGSISNASPRVLTAAAHGLLTGQTLTIAGVTGATDVNGIWTVTRTGANTVTLNGSTATGAATVTSATAVLTAQRAYGTADLVTADFAANAQSYAATTGQLYDSYDIISEGVTAINTARIWCNANAAASPSTVTVNYSTFVADMVAFQTATQASTNVSIAKILGIPTV